MNAKDLTSEDMVKLQVRNPVLSLPIRCFGVLEWN